MRKVSRRRFIRSGMIISGFTMFGASFVPRWIRAMGVPGLSQIISISGDNPMTSVPRLVDGLGGISKFVRQGASVGILVNSPWKNPGTATNPSVALAVVRLCLDAGAREITCFKPVPEGYWQKSEYYEGMKEAVSAIKYGDERITVEIPKGIHLKSAQLYSEFMDVDVFISIPVAKHHDGTNFSCNLKGLMGVSTGDTNRHMHSPDGEYTYEKQAYLSQCIADLNLVRRPDLCVVDAIECCLENGPRGPGATVKPNRILAGTDPVALDAYAAQLIGFDISTIPSIEMAKDLGLGESRSEMWQVQEIG